MIRRLHLLAVLPLLTVPLSAQAASQVGSAAAVRNDVTGSIAGQMQNGSSVHQDETVSTGTDSSTQLLFLDKTSLTMGPTSQVKIDKFVYNPNTGTAGTSVDLVKGALRVITGSKHPENFTVQTPLANTGVRGSVAELYVSNMGFEFFLLIEGSIEVCAASNNCQFLSNPGQFIMITPEGRMFPPAPWPGPMLDLTASVAFLETYFSSIIRQYDVLPQYRDLNDALRAGTFKAPDFTPFCFGEGCPP